MIANIKIVSAVMTIATPITAIVAASQSSSLMTPILPSVPCRTLEITNCEVHANQALFYRTAFGS
jgi:hypothetical protein